MTSPRVLATPENLAVMESILDRLRASHADVVDFQTGLQLMNEYEEAELDAAREGDDALVELFRCARLGILVVLVDKVKRDMELNKL